MYLDGLCIFVGHVLRHPQAISYTYPATGSGATFPDISPSELPQHQLSKSIQVL